MTGAVPAPPSKERIATLRKSSLDDKSVARAATMCSMFTAGGWCRWGTSCKFLHEDSGILQGCPHELLTVEAQLHKDCCLHSRQARRSVCQECGRALRSAQHAHSF